MMQFIYSKEDKMLHTVKQSKNYLVALMIHL